MVPFIEIRNTGREVKQVLERKGKGFDLVA